MAKSVKSGAFLAGLLVGILTTWLQPYNELDVFGVDFRIITAIAAVIISFIYRLWTGAGTRSTGIYIGTGIVSAFILRIVYDSFIASSAHNLWTLEIILFVVIAFPAALIGAYLGELTRWSGSGK